MIFIMTTDPKELKKLARRGQRNRIYARPDWLMTYFYHNILNSTSHNWAGMVLVVNKRKPIAAALVREDGFSCYYVKPEYRRKGIGTKMVEKLRTINPNLTAMRGIPESVKFFQKNQIQSRYG